MQAIRLIFNLSFFFLFLNAYNFGCSDKYEIIKENGKYIIHVYDDSTEDDLSLEAKAFLMSYLKNKNKIKGNFIIEMRDFLETQNYKCNNDIHQVFEVPINKVKIVQINSSNKKSSYLDYKRKIYYKIAEIELKENLNLNDLKKLYNLYFVIGKINEANKIMDRIMNYKMKGF